MNTDQSLPHEAETVVIGGGIIGCSIAYQLAEIGRSVVLLERDEIASKSSSKAAGYVSHIGDDLNKLLINAAGWEIFEKFAAQGDIELHRYPILILVRENDPAEIFEEIQKIPAAGEAFFGKDSPHLGRVLTREEVLAEIPMTTADDIIVDGHDLGKVIAGYMGPKTDAYVDPYVLTSAFARNAGKAGAILRTHTRVTEISVEKGQVTGVRTDQGDIKCRYVVNAAGAWAPKVGEFVGLKIPIKAGRRILLIVEREQKSDEKLGVMYADEIEAVTKRNGLYLRDDSAGFVGGGSHNTNGVGDPGVDPDNYEQGYNFDDVTEFADRLEQTFPEFGEFVVKGGHAGLYGVVADNNFIIDEVDSLRGFIICAGFCGMGIASSGGAGKAVTEIITKGDIEFLANPELFAYSSERFPEISS